MSLDMDSFLDFCLACDRQTDGQVYCSESCRLAEYEKASSNPSSTASSPRSPAAAAALVARPGSPPATLFRNPFFLEPAYNFHLHHPAAAVSAPRPRLAPIAIPPTLTPSASLNSLVSIQSSAAPSQTVAALVDPVHLSAESKKALRAYASSFDQSRNSRRQSTH